MKVASRRDHFDVRRSMFDVRCSQKQKSRRVQNLSGSLGAQGILTTAETFSAVQALVTGAVANGDVAAVRTRRRVLLEMGDSIAQVFHHAIGGGVMPMAVAVARL